MEYEEEKKHLEQIVKGVHQLQIEQVLAWDKSVPMLAGMDYYQGVGADSDTYSLMIRQGGDLRKGRRMLETVAHESKNPNIPKDKRKVLLDEYGVVQEELLIDLKGGGKAMIVSSLKEPFRISFGKLARDSIQNQMVTRIRKIYKEGLDFIGELAQTEKVLNYFFFLYTHGVTDYSVMMRRALICYLMGRYQRMQDDILAEMCESAIFLDVWQAIDQEHICTKKVEFRDLCDLRERLLEPLEIGSGHKKLMKKIHLNMTIAKSTVTERILQASEVFTRFVEGGFYCISDQVEQRKASTDFENSLTELVSLSNPKINDNSKDPILPEQTISYLANLLGYGHLIERERQIRSEVLAKCEHTACVINRVSIACNHPNLTGREIKESTFCEGQGTVINMIGKAGRGPFLPKCQKGSDLLGQINLRIREIRKEVDE